MPTRPPNEIRYAYLKDILKNADFLFPIPAEWVDFFSKGEFERRFNDAESDYIYSISDMVTYSGNKRYKKRNLLKQFVQGYEHQSYPLIEMYREAAIEILNSWQDNSGQDKRDTDYYACLEALRMSEKLILCGMIYYVGKEPAGFVLGEELTPDMFDIKSAKAKEKFKGVYQYLYNDFAKILPKKYVYFNFEEDLGTQALRTAKSSYKPSKKIAEIQG
ncbi:MAG: phosphatidylglycerol lysyltransferase domain-containing protein [Candidatus Omnitrophota bacterium]